MRRGFIKWVPRGQGNERFFRTRSMDLVRGDEAALALPSAATPLPERDEAIFLLQTAAEIEHALLAQYLYAAFSFGDPKYRSDLSDDQKKLVFGTWHGRLRTIAIEEMGHLVTVQNVLRLIGGPLNLEREDFPFRTHFYPFPFTLEPVSKDSLAKYVATEKPESPDIGAYAQINEIVLRAVQANNTLPINRVGVLYERIIELIEQMDLKHILPQTGRTFQAPADEWRQTEDPNDPRSVIVWSFGGSRAEARDKAVRALRFVAEQGEGPSGGSIENSHFHSFYELYKVFPETNPRYGKVEWNPALLVPTNPSTSPDPFSDAAREDNRITDPLSVLWGQLFNSRYRIVLGNILHGLMIDRSVDQAGRSELIEWAFGEMSNLIFVSGVLSRMPRQLPNLCCEGVATVAGAPFELPYTLNLSDIDEARWRMQRDVIEESAALISEIRKRKNNPTDAETVLSGIETWDASRLPLIRQRIGATRALPRLYFSGKFTTNVNTVNNNDFQQAIDATQTKVDLQGKSESEFRSWMKEVVDLGQGRSAIRSGWNYFGDNGCRFVDSTITAIEGTTASTSTDAIVGAAVRLEGIMVDVDPTNVFDTQIFSDLLSISGADGLSISGKPTILHSRWLNFSRNLAAAGSRAAGTVFQAGLSWDNGLSISPGNSQALKDLQQATKTARGILVTFSTHLVAAAMNTTQLASEYAAGREPSNPATGILVGHIMPWNEGELASVPPGRRLDPVAAPDDNVPVGPATVRFDPDRKSILLNFLASIPEVGASLEKFDFGPLSIYIEGNDGPSLIGELPFTRYNRAAYLATSGLIEVTVPDELLAEVETGTLSITQKSTERVLLKEVVWSAETDERGFYLQDGEERGLKLAVLHQSLLPVSPVDVYLTELVFDGNYRPVTDDERILTIPAKITIDKTGEGTVRVQANKPGARFIGLAVGTPITGPIDPMTGSYAAVRVLPKDNYSSVPDSDLSFEKAYAEVLQYYHLAYPAMSKVFPLNDKDAVTEQAGAILSVIDKSKWARYSYMPRTRELSDGKRELLARFARKVISDPPPTNTPEDHMLRLVAFLKSAPHNAANRHLGVDISTDQTLASLFADPPALLNYLTTGTVVNDSSEQDNKLVVKGKPAESAFYRLIQRAGHPMTSRFALPVPDTGKTGLQVVEAWILSLA